MSDLTGPMSRSEREARRALLHEALTDLAGARDPERAADEVMRALDGYLEAAPRTAPAPREPPVTDFDRRERSDVRLATGLVMGGAVIATGIVAVVLSGGWPAGIAVVAIWAVALFALASS